MGRGNQQRGRGGGNSGGRRGRRGHRGRGRGGRGGRSHPDGNDATNHPLPQGEALDFAIKSFHPDALSLFQSCPATLLNNTNSNNNNQPQTNHRFHLATWTDLPSLLTWFKQLVLLDPDAILSFSPRLTKDQRASVFNAVKDAPPDISAALFPFSQGFGDHRHTSIAQKRKIESPSKSSHVEEPPAATGAAPRNPRDGGLASRSVTDNEREQAVMLRRWLQRDAGIELSRDESIELVCAIVQKAAEDNTTECPSSSATAEGSFITTIMSGGGSSNSNTAVSTNASSNMAPLNTSTTTTTTTTARATKRNPRNVIPAEVLSIWHKRWPLQQGAHALNHAVSLSDPDAVSTTIQQHRVAVVTGAYDETTGLGPLHLAASLGFVEAMEALLSAGVPVNALDGTGSTALEVSRKFEQCDAEGVLLRAGAEDPDEKRGSILLDKRIDVSIPSGVDHGEDKSVVIDNEPATMKRDIPQLTVESVNETSMVNGSPLTNDQSMHWTEWAKNVFLFNNKSTSKGSGWWTSSPFAASSSMAMTAGAYAAAIAVGVAAVVVVARGKRHRG